MNLSRDVLPASKHNRTLELTDHHVSSSKSRDSVSDARYCSQAPACRASDCRNVTHWWRMPESIWIVTFVLMAPVSAMASRSPLRGIVARIPPGPSR